MWIQPWLKAAGPQITSQHCSDLLPYKPLKTAPVLGGSRLGNSKDDDVLTAAQFAVEEINAKSNSMYKDIVLNVTHVVRQVSLSYHSLLV